LAVIEPLSIMRFVSVAKKKKRLGAGQEGGEEIDRRDSGRTKVQGHHVTWASYDQPWRKYSLSLGPLLAAVVSLPLL
jgi:hypothetical protein